ncbi:MAG: hypothetical protein AAGA31_14710 [Bacteroidota bacterium]
MKNAQFWDTTNPHFLIGCILRPGKAGRKFIRWVKFDGECRHRTDQSTKRPIYQ